jgi:tetratricopeptide (TPR) repeat protein
VSAIATALVLQLGLFSALSLRARASDFWDEVRSPGLAAHRLHLRRGARALAENLPYPALSESEAAIARCPECAGGYTLRGRAFAALGQHGASVFAFQQALRQRADALDADGVALVAAANAFRIGRADLTVTILTRALALDRDPDTRVRALPMLADALQARGPEQLERALVAYREALQDDDARSRTLLGLALALHRSGEVEQALALARRAGSNAETSSWLPDSEREARAALWLTAIGDREAAEQAWARAAAGGGPWADHAQAVRAAASHAGAR